VDDVAHFALFRPVMTGFGAISFRPQLWVRNYPAFDHNPYLPQNIIEADEAVRPNVLSVHAWGAQGADGEWSYTRKPEDSRARGGTGDGGVLFHPPHLTMEDYFGIGSTVDVTASETQGYVMVAPGVGFAWGVPELDGDITDGGFTSRSVSDVLTFGQRQSGAHSDLLSMTHVGTEKYVDIKGTTSVRIPSGTTLQQPLSPVVGEIRINTDDTALEFFDGSWQQLTPGHTTTYEALTDTPSGYGSSGDVVTSTGLAHQYETPVTEFSGNPNELVRTDDFGLLDQFITPASAPTYTSLSDAPGSFVGDGLKLVRVNTGETALEHVDGDTLYRPTADVMLHDGTQAMTGNLRMGTTTYPTVTDWKEIQKVKSAVVAGNAVELLQAVGAFFPFTGGTITGATIISGGSLTMNDSIPINFGTSGGEGFIKSDGADLLIDPAGSVVKIADEASVETSLAVGQTAVADANAVLEAESTTKGFLPPRMTTTQRGSVGDTEGLIVYDTDTESLWIKVPDGAGGFQWEEFTHAAP
jgi:hypothetical protein